MKTRHGPGDRLRRGFGNPKPPAVITQEPYEGNDGHLRRLARLPSDALPDAGDLYDYTEDLRYGSGEIQVDLLLWVLPYCLRAWLDDLRGRTRQYGGFVEHFDPMLANDKVQGALTDTQRLAVAAFMREGLLEEIDDQKGLSYSGTSARPYKWIYAHATYGVLFSGIERLWIDWWGLSTRGRAVAALQYVSCLVYGEDDNPVFAAWTRDTGGGPPQLWEYAGHLYEHCWLEQNLQFIRSFLEPARMLDRLRRAAAILASEEEGPVAQKVLAGALDRADMLAGRCAELPRILAQRQQPAVLLDWPR